MTVTPDQTGEIRYLVRRLSKRPEDWRRSDLLRLCLDDGIRVLNLRYPSLDGKLRELRIPVNNRAYLDRVLAAGERVDGSSLFPGLFGAARSDLYVVPVYRWAFLDPWSKDELHVVCRFADSDGNPCSLTPDNVLAAQSQRLTESTGARLFALGELEFYLILDRLDDRFTSRSQRNYHQSAPYLHGRPIADEILRVVSAVSGLVKYCHSEVGYIDRLGSSESELDGRRVEQYELEFDLMPVEDLGCWLTVARWLIRVVADRHRASATFLPKLDEGMAGSGMHVHLAVWRDGLNATADESGELSDDALRLIGGLLEQAPALTGFGNSVAASYLRLVPGQEAPTDVCWGRRDRSSLIRVPLSFQTGRRLDQVMNPGDTGDYPTNVVRPTIEYRGPDGSAFTLLLLAAVTLSAERGLSSPDAAELARRLERRVAGQEPSSADDAPMRLPANAVAAAEALSASRSVFEDAGFPAPLIDHVLGKLQAEQDDGLSEKLRRLPDSERLAEARRLMHKDLHKH